MTPSAPQRRRRRTLRRILGPPDHTDSLKTVAWMVKALGLIALEIDGDRDLTPQARRAELIRVAGAMAKLKDQDRLFQAEQTLRAHRSKIIDSSSDGPLLRPAPSHDALGQPIKAHRGKPPKRPGAL